ncbi:hypothetical protein D9M72_558550 [compost metagenome]
MRIVPVADRRAGDAFLRIYSSHRRMYVGVGRVCALEPSVLFAAVCRSPTPFPNVVNGGRARCRPDCRRAGRRGSLLNLSTGKQEIRT